MIDWSSWFISIIVYVKGTLPDLGELQGLLTHQPAGLNHFPFFLGIGPIVKCRGNGGNCAALTLVASKPLLRLG